jgi:hypothetical protein
MFPRAIKNIIAENISRNCNKTTSDSRHWNRLVTISPRHTQTLSWSWACLQKQNFSSRGKTAREIFVSSHSSDIHFHMCARRWFLCVGYKRMIIISSNRYFACELQSYSKLKNSFRRFPFCSAFLWFLCES